MGVGNGEKNTFTLKIRVGHAHAPDQLRSSNLAPDEVIRVVDHAHLVGFRIPNPEFYRIADLRRLHAANVPAVSWAVKPRPDALRSANMSAKPIMVVSDIHLGAVPPDTERSFRRFLGFVAGGASGLLINGDLFDFWFEYRTVVPRQHLRVLAALADVVESGVPVWFVGGNHDAWGGSFLRDEIGMTLLQGPCEMTLAGYCALIAHGDGVGPGDRGYKALRSFIRHPWTVRSFRTIHPDLGSRIAARASSTEHKVETADPGGESRAHHIQRWATERLGARPDLDLVLAGHAHVPVVLEVEPRRFYVNSGDWLKHFSYVALSPGETPALARWGS